MESGTEQLDRPERAATAKQGNTAELGGTAEQDRTESTWTVLFDLWLLQQAAYPLIEKAIHRAGLSVDEFGLYVMLEEFGPVTPGEIADLTGMRANTISASLRRLDDRGHTTRTRNERDGRSVFIELTESGATQIQMARQLNLGLVKRICDGMDVDRVRSAIAEFDDQVREVGNMPELPRPAPTGSE
jgi:DNA-binding MarR family transcriptional regulator